MTFNKKEYTLLALLFVGLLWALYIVMSNRTEIPLHLNLFGEVDAMGSKETIFILPCLAISCYLLLTFLQKRPHWCNLPTHTRLTEEEMKRWAEELIYAVKTISITLLISLEILLVIAPTAAFWVSFLLILLLAGVVIRYYQKV